MNTAQKVRNWFRSTPASPGLDGARVPRPFDEDAGADVDVAPEHDSVLVDRDDRLDRVAESDAWS